MGDLKNWSAKPVMASLHSDNQIPVEVDATCWEKVEQVAQQILTHVKPTFISEQRRKDVVEYISTVIKESLGCEVFQFGSVPLKTYLPDGDIDLTIFGAVHVEDTLANDVVCVLKREEMNMNAKFFVSDIQLIRAEVKLVKCLVQNIVVDISFNQLGGLSTLCFLEQVDRMINKDNLFKRSIVLIKAWCYYESRVLGSHHGLISTYGLETMILYVFQLFHKSLNGPFQVLYKFLEFFSKFEWDKYCVSLSGPVPVDCLPELVAEAHQNGGSDLLLSDDFLSDSLEMFTVPSMVCETQLRTFPRKFLNIFDPLKDYNNLGRSVSKGNFYRVISAFKFGFRRLTQILSSPQQSWPDQINIFFSNALDKERRNMRPDVYNLLPSHYSPYIYQKDVCISEVGSGSFRGNLGHCKMEFHGSLSYEPRRDPMMIETDANRMGFSGHPNELATSIGGGFGVSDEVHGPPDCVPNLTGDYAKDLKCLRYGWWWYDYEQSGRTLQAPTPMDNTFQMKGQWEMNETQLSPYNGKLSVPYQPFYPHMNQPNIHGAAWQRGTGTYLPDMKHFADRPLIPRGRNQTQGRSYHNNGNSITPSAVKLPQKCSFKLSQEQFPSLQDRENPRPKVPPVQNGYAKVSNGSIVPAGNGAKLAHPKDEITKHPEQVMIAEKKYQLKDEEDFPPLSG